MISMVEKHASTKLDKQSFAPGGPGIAPRWAQGAKEAVGTAIPTHSRIWFTVVGGALSELFFPSIDVASTRSMRFLVTDGHHFFSDESQEPHRVYLTDTFAPCICIDTEQQDHVYSIRKEIVTDPSRDALLMHIRFAASKESLRLYLYMDAHIDDLGAGNDGWVGQYKSIPMLFASRGGVALATATSAPFRAASAGFVGVNDGFTNLTHDKQLTYEYTDALNGNIGLVGEIDWASSNGEFVVALAGGGHPAEAALQARASLLQDFSDVKERYVEGWRKAQDSWLDLGMRSGNGIDYYRVSTAILQTHESKRFPGATIASLSSPWGAVRGDKKTGGYHVLWPRDMGETAIGRLAAGDFEGALRTLFYLRCTQEESGKWVQSMWLDGTPHWTATQLDGPGLAILLADFLRRESDVDLRPYHSMVCKAAGFLVREGPCTEQDRWEANSGYTPFTMAVDIAALLAAADFADADNRACMARFLRETADAWNALVDEMTYVEGTELARRQGVKGYYIRIAPPEAISSPRPGELIIHLNNRPKAESEWKAADVISVDALALVRFGLRAADDPRILNTVAIIDATLRTETATGPIWHRYTNDGYGEQKDGAPFEGIGIGRGWSLFAGERAHFEIARGRFTDAELLRKTMEAQANECGLFPEQVWDVEDIPARALVNGRATGSSMPLVWAHAEYIKLLRSLRERRVWDMPSQTTERYVIGKTGTSFNIWTLTAQRTRLQSGMNLRIDLPAGARVRWSLDRWNTFQDIDTTDSGLGIHYALLKLDSMRTMDAVEFTFFWTQLNQWEGKNFRVQAS